MAKALAAAQGAAAMPEAGVSDGASVLQGPAGAPKAELTDTTLVLGTGRSGLYYRADLHAFGVVAYEMLTGATPFAGRPRHEQLAP